MRTARLPENEAACLRVLEAYNILDTPAEAAFDDITMIAAQIGRSPMALISLVDSDRQWFKSRIGVEAAQTPRDFAFCSHAILNADTVMVVRDTHQDERFADNPLVTSEPHIRFYAGAPLVAEGGEALGTLCVLDREPSDLDGNRINALRALARQVMFHLEFRRTEVSVLRVELDRARDEIEDLRLKLAQVTEIQEAHGMEASFRERAIERPAVGRTDPTIRADSEPGFAHEALYPMQTVVERTGISPQVIREWERRYRAVTRQQTGRAQSRYTQDDIDRLLLLRQAVDGGHDVGKIARFSLRQLQALIEPNQEST